jgi:hypothetical protein
MHSLQNFQGSGDFDVDVTKETFTCELCKGKFEKAWDDKEAMQESIELWGNVPPQDLAMICDDCFYMFL